MSQAQSGHGRQIQLPFRKAVEISIKSIRIRFWRSMITAAGIFLGIAFFTSVRVSANFSAIQSDIIAVKKADIDSGRIKPTAEDNQMIAASVANPAEEAAAK